MRVSVIVLSFNGVSETLACLASLQSHADNAFDILVVDNASSDGAAAAIRARYPQIPLIELPENLGWAGGNNAGIKYAIEKGADLICLLNNDTIIPPGVVEELARAARRHGPCLMHPAIDYSDPQDGPQIDPSQPSQSGRYPETDQEAGVYELDFAYGACLMIPVTLFREIGLFDERFFLQLEETDFWMRARKLGVRSLCTTHARIIHLESRSFGGRKTPVKTYYAVRNMLLLIEKNHRTAREKWRALRSLYWTIAQAVNDDGITAPLFLRLMWPFSRSTFVFAARAGFRDYVFRNFGRISSATYQSITR
jgi:GT2 family glycosyltransferase